MRTLRVSDRGDDVRALQHALTAHGHGSLVLDGDFGPATKRAVEACQRAHGLVVDGVAGPGTQAVLGLGEVTEETPVSPSGPWVGAITTMWARFEDAITKECTDGMTPACALAVMAVESNGQGVSTIDGAVYPLIRFETHLFQSEVDRAVFDKHFRQDATKPWTQQQYRVDPDVDPWTDVHTGSQTTEYNALDLASSLNSNGAHRSMSMGMAQILGRWASRLGYPSAYDMWAASKDEDAQVHMLFEFLRTGSDDNRNPDGDLWQSAVDQRWRDFARQYNGPGQVDYYSTHLADAYGTAVAVLAVR